MRRSFTGGEEIRSKVSGNPHFNRYGLSIFATNSLTDQVIGSAIEVHRHLGPGLLESIYRECLMMELHANQLRLESERFVPIEYKGRRVRGGLKLDLVVEGCLVVELKAVEALHPVHSAQVLTYLRLTGFPAGLLMNFNVTALQAGLRRLDHPDRYVKKQEGRRREQEDKS